MSDFRRFEDFEIGAEARDLTGDRMCVLDTSLDADPSDRFGRPDRHAGPEPRSRPLHDLSVGPGPRATVLARELVGD
jgi:hypothetical protein